MKFSKLSRRLRNNMPFTLIELLAVPAVAVGKFCATLRAHRSLGEVGRQVRKVFTLIELLVVIAIISILMAMLLP